MTLFLLLLAAYLLTGVLGFVLSVRAGWVYEEEALFSLVANMVGWPFGLLIAIVDAKFWTRFSRWLYRIASR